MIKYTLWSPDTCGCQIEYSWDDSVDAKDRVHTCVSIRKKCEHHAYLMDKHKHHNEILKENQMKNKVITKITESIPSIYEEIEIDGAKHKRLKKDKNILWYFDNARKLCLTLEGFSNDEKQITKNIMDIDYTNQINIEEDI
jgi:hypothetical protein